MARRTFDVVDVILVLQHRVAELHSRVAALVLGRTGISGLPDLGAEAWSEYDRHVMAVPRQRTIRDHRGVSQQADLFAETPRSGAGPIRRHAGPRPGRRTGPLRCAPGADSTVGGVWGAGPQ